MSTLRQYFETDLDYYFRARVEVPDSQLTCSGAMCCDANSNSVFLAFYFEDQTLRVEEFEAFLGLLKYGSTALAWSTEVVMPKPRYFPGRLSIGLQEGIKAEYKYFGDPSWRDLLKMVPTCRVFIYAETNFPEEAISVLQNKARKFGHDLVFRDATYRDERTAREVPLAFLSHDSRDKSSIARPIAVNLLNKVCPVWYDEFSIEVGGNLFDEIERGLKVCKKCVVIVTPHFLANTGWVKRELDSASSRELFEGVSVLLPVWSGVTAKEVYRYSSALASVKAIDWDTLGEAEVCRLLYLAITGG